MSTLTNDEATEWAQGLINEWAPGVGWVRATPVGSAQEDEEPHRIAAVDEEACVFNLSGWASEGLEDSAAQMFRVVVVATEVDVCDQCTPQTRDECMICDGTGWAPVAAPNTGAVGPLSTAIGPDAVVGPPAVTGV